MTNFSIYKEKTANITIITKINKDGGKIETRVEKNNIS